MEKRCDDVLIVCFNMIIAQENRALVKKFVKHVRYVVEK